MTAALSAPTAAMPTSATATGPAAASPLAGLGSRVKRLDPNELYALAMQGSTAQGAAPQGAAPQGVASPQQATTAAQDAALAEAMGQVDRQPDAIMAGSAATQATTAAASTARPATTEAPAATERAAGSGSAVAVPSSTIAPRRTNDFWNAHIAQFRGKYLPDGPTMRPNCGPAATTTALRLLGLDVPGFNGQRSEAVLDKARVIATGQNDTSRGTTDTELERLVTSSGARWSESSSFDQMTSWARQGIPVVMSGNPSKAWNSRYTSDQVYPFDGGHWVTVSGYDAKTGYYVVNDPLSQIGPIYVSETELRNYNNAHGKLGIAVFK